VRDGLERANLRVLSVGGIPTRVYEAGTGAPLVLIHGGAFGELYSLDCWSLTLPLLSGRFRTVAFDKLGQGHTSGPRDEGGYAFAAVLGHALALLDRLALGPVHLVGHSMGALLAAEIALARPEHACSLVLVDSNTVAADDPRHPRGRFYRELEARMPAGAPNAASVRMEPDAQSWSSAHVSDDFVERLLEIANLPAFRETATRMRRLRDSVWRPSLETARARLHSALDAHGLPCPTLLAWGAEDPSAPLPLAAALLERIAARTPRAELHVFARAGHYCFREQPEPFARLLAGFCGG
jgi:pimeloyl-ACP methyl ester carboxylesterase